MPVPEDDKAPATRYRNAQLRMLGGVGCQSCRRPMLHVPDGVCDWPGPSQARHVARCNLHDARYSLLLAALCLWDGWTSRPATQSVHRVQGLQAQNHSEDEMQLHVLHHMDDRCSHE